MRQEQYPWARAAIAGRPPGGRESSLEAHAGGGRRRPGNLPPVRHQVGRRACRCRWGASQPVGALGLNAAASAARVAGRAGEAAAAGGAGLRQCAGPASATTRSC
ncbi:MAG: hypothetical protein MZW92_02160 [Comamonadaceae bacterium]|nr:hypothetical protein [Comamonadaceae bacterium]